MTNYRMVKKLYEWKLTATRLAEKLKLRWKKDIKEIPYVRRPTNAL
jgi:hypothetical protein